LRLNPPGGGRPPPRPPRLPPRPPAGPPPRGARRGARGRRRPRRLLPRPVDHRVARLRLRGGLVRAPRAPFARNGTFMVYRKLEQDVDAKAINNALREASEGRMKGILALPSLQRLRRDAHMRC
jgi:hypothetical protein